MVIVEGRRADQEYIVYYLYDKMFGGKGKMVDESVFNVNSVRKAVKPGGVGLKAAIYSKRHQVVSNEYSGSTSNDMSL